MRALIHLIIIGTLSACSGAMYAIPKAGENDIATAQKEISARKMGTVPKRTHYQKRVLIKKIENRLNANIAPVCKQSGDKKCVFTIKYSKEDTINAYATSNRVIVFFSGLSDILTNEDEYAAVLAHEMGHHMAGHLKKGKRNTMIGAAIGGILGAVVESQTGTSGSANATSNVANDSMVAGAALGRLTYSKAMEREADYLSAYMLARAGYDLEKAKILWARLAKAGGGMDKKTGIFDSHPAGAERIATWTNVMKEIETNPSHVPKLKGKSKRKSK